MPTASREALKRSLENQIDRLDSRINRLKAQSNRLSVWRLAAFIVGALFFYLSLLTDSSMAVIGVLLAAITGFALLVRYHNRLDAARQWFEIWRSIRREHLGRMNLDWNALPSRSEHHDDKSHPFALDLNITGPHSLLQLIDTCHFDGGRLKLKEWLLAHQHDREKIKQRQKLVRELAPKLQFRDRIQLNARLQQKHHDDKDWSLDQMMKWLDHTGQLNFQPALGILATLSALTIVLFGLNMAGLVGPYYFFTFVVYLGFYIYNSGKMGELFDEAYQLEKGLKEIFGVIHYLETYPYQDGSLLKTYCEPFHAEEEQPSRFLKKLIRLAAGASLKENQILWALINMVVPWDMFFASRLHRYKKKLSPELHRWMDRLSGLEAHCALANFAGLNPSYTFAAPSGIKADEPVFQARGLGHPLIPVDRKVTNDLRINELGSLLLITGSNMSGKSTFLRTVGINLALCNAGAPVNAHSFNTIPFRLFSSINITDSLDEGLSHFYAEVKQLRKLLDELKREADQPLFFFVDEIFRGTNNRERLRGSTAFIREVSGTQSVGMISTHDLELAGLEDEILQLTNYHFEETIRDGRMSFEYKLKKGPCSSTNALRIMEMEGLPVPGDDR